MVKELSSIWELYGLKANPFSTDPLLLEGGIISLDTFVGRTQELKRMAILFRIGGGTRIMVSGEMGVGKTTFVNYAKNRALQELNFFTPLKEIDTQPEWTSEDLITNTLAMIYVTLERKKIKISETIKKKLSYLFDILEVSGTSGSFSIMGTGMGLGKTVTTTQPRITATFLKELFTKVIDELKKQGYRQIILHYNNLENFEQQELIALFNKIRDFLQNEDIHFIFVGGVTVPSSLQRTQKVSSIFPDSPIYLQNFSLNEIKAILGKRISSLKIGEMGVLRPYEDDAIKELNDIYKGNIRAILNSLSTAIIELINIGRGKPLILSAERLKIVLKKVLKERYLSKMSPIDLKVLKKILEQKEVTNKKLAEILNKKPQNISKNLNKLQKLNAIYVKRTVGTEKYFEITHQIKWLKFDE